MPETKPDKKKAAKKSPGKGAASAKAAAVKFVYDFHEGNKDLKDLLGGKGANLAEMTNLGLPVPPGFTITTDACKVYLASGAEPPPCATRSAPTSTSSNGAWARSSARPTTRCWSPYAPAPSSPCPA